MDVLHDEFILFITCALKNNLRFLLIGGFAVNFYGYNRNTDDMDVWLAPTNENRQAFINTLLCMNYSENEVAPLYKEDFSKHFVGNIGSDGARIDVLTIVHHAISFDEAEKNKQVFKVAEDVLMPFVPYEFLKDIKLRSSREKDLYDIARLEEIRNLKK